MNNSNFGNVSSATLKILRVGVGVVNFFSYLCVVATFMNNSNFGNVSSATLKILRVGVGVVNFFFLFMRCSNVYEQFKFRKCVKCDFENIEGWGWGR